MSTAAIIIEEVEGGIEVVLDNAVEEAVSAERSIEVDTLVDILDVEDFLRVAIIEGDITARRYTIYIRRRDTSLLTTPRKSRKRREPYILQTAISQAP